jgi:5-methyltetrahydrofolate--homocysteine methyltransferase
VSGILLIGEQINASRKSVRDALAREDKLYLQDLAKRQAEAGVDYIDINVGIGGGREHILMEWVVEAVQEVMDKSLALDTVDSRVLQAGLAKCKTKALVNSINGERERLSSFLPLLQEHGSPCIAMAIDERGILKEPWQRVELCKHILHEVEGYGIGMERIYFDPAVMPLAAEQDSGWVVLETLRLIKSQLPGAKTALGLSNISYGLPKRSLLNQVFLSMASLAGLDCVILDPLDEGLMFALKAGSALIGRERGCREYLRFYRRGGAK